MCAWVCERCECTCDTVCMCFLGLTATATGLINISVGYEDIGAYRQLDVLRQALRARFRAVPVCNITNPSITTSYTYKQKASGSRWAQCNAPHESHSWALIFGGDVLCVWLKTTEGLKNLCGWSLPFVCLKYHYCRTFCCEGARLISFWGATYWSFRASWCNIWRSYLLANIRA